MKTDENANSNFNCPDWTDSPLIQPESQPAMHQKSATSATTSVGLSNFPAMITDETDTFLLREQWFFQPMAEESPENFTALKQYLNLGPARTLEQLSIKTNDVASVSFDLCKKFRWESGAAAFDPFIIDRKKSEPALRSANSDLNHRFLSEIARNEQWLIHNTLQKVGLENIPFAGSPGQPRVSNYWK